MQVHARAPLSPIGRRRVVDRVRVEDVVGDGGGRGRRRHRAHGLSVAGALSRSRPGGSGRPSAGRPLPAAQDAGRPGRGDLRAAPVAHDRRARSPRCLLMPLSTVSAVLSARRARQALAAGADRAAQPLRAPARRASSSTSTSKSSAGSSSPATPSPATAANALTARGSGHRPDARSGRPAGSSCTSPIDDHSRLAYAEVLPDETASSAIAFLRRALAFFARHGIQRSARHDRRMLLLCQLGGCRSACCSGS